MNCSSLVAWSAAAALCLGVFAVSVARNSEPDAQPPQQHDNQEGEAAGLFGLVNGKGFPFDGAVSYTGADGSRRTEPSTGRFLPVGRDGWCIVIVSATPGLKSQGVVAQVSVGREWRNARGVPLPQHVSSSATINLLPDHVWELKHKPRAAAAIEQAIIDLTTKTSEWRDRVRQNNAFPIPLMDYLLPVEFVEVFIREQ